MFDVHLFFHLFPFNIRCWTATVNSDLLNLIIGINLIIDISFSTIMVYHVEQFSIFPDFFYQALEAWVIYVEYANVNQAIS